MTEIQAKTLLPALAGMDVLARARTGTGKTVGFLVPSIERVQQQHRGGGGGEGIDVLVISPTRELASQIGQPSDYRLC